MDDSGVQTARQLVLDPHPASASAARQWIREQLSLLGRDELVDCAELATSELVTNAVLHARTVVTVVLEHSEDRWRVAISDRSPGMATPVHQRSGQVWSSGRGLHILSSISHRWGIEDEPPGKRIWFEPVADDAHSSAAAVATAPVHRDPSARRDRRHMELRHAPVPLLRQTGQRLADLHREMLLVSFASQEDRPSGQPADIADRLVELARAVQPIITELLPDELLDQLSAAGTDVANLTCRFPPAGVDVTAWPDLLDEADDYCRGERLLTLAAPRREAMARRWLLTEMARQSSGLQPVSWPDYVDTV